jgi:uncharacterized membrane protein
MNSLSKLFRSLNFGLALLLALLFLFENRIDVMGWQVIVGRFHPLVLHLPIGIFMLAVLISFFRKAIPIQEFNQVFTFVVNLAVATGFLSAISGIVLASEEQESISEILYWHKVGGIVFSYTLYVFSIWFLKLTETIQQILLISLLIILMFTGHKGAVMTHGENFLALSSANAQNQGTFHPDSSIYQNVIQPILERKCMSCHNATKSKGNLIMTDSLSLVLGGKNGAAFVAGDANKSLMFQRMLLPDNHEEHMPPIGKTQLSINEVKILESWINAGASYSQKLDDIQIDSAYYPLIKSVYNSNKKPAKIYTFKSAPQKEIDNLQSSFRKVYPLYQKSPALAVSYLLTTGFTMETLRDLEKIKTQIIELNLNNMPMEDSGMDLINTMENLEILFLNNTKITTNGVKTLSKNKNLRHLSLTNTSVNEEVIDLLPQLPNLKKIFLSDTKISPASIDTIRAQFPNIEVIFEDYSYIVTYLTPPLLENDENIVDNNSQIKLKHYVNGVMVKYTLNDEEPDSINSLTYKEPIEIKNFVNIKAKAFKSGWIGSDTKNFTLFTKGIKPKEATLITKTNDRYKGEGGATLINNKLGPISNLPNPNWLGFQDEPFEALFSFDKPTALSTVILSFGLSIPQHVFPPTIVKVFGGNDIKSLKEIALIKLPTFQPENKDQVKNDKLIIPLKGENYEYYKIFAQNLKVIPSWHQGKGNKAWVFVDEIFFYQ